MFTWWITLKYDRPRGNKLRKETPTSRWRDLPLQDSVSESTAEYHVGFLPGVEPKPAPCKPWVPSQHDRRPRPQPMDQPSAKRRGCAGGFPGLRVLVRHKELGRRVRICTYVSGTWANSLSSASCCFRLQPPASIVVSHRRRKGRGSILGTARRS